MESSFNCCPFILVPLHVGQELAAIPDMRTKIPHNLVINSSYNFRGSFILMQGLAHLCGDISERENLLH